jgi:hypothetical protein
VASTISRPAARAPSGSRLSLIELVQLKQANMQNAQGEWEISIICDRGFVGDKLTDHAV